MQKGHFFRVHRINFSADSSDNVAVTDDLDENLEDCCSDSSTACEVTVSENTRGIDVLQTSRNDIGCIKKRCDSACQ